MQETSYMEVPTNKPEVQIVKQPRAAVYQERWMSIPIGSPHCPRGLEYLTALDQLLISHKPAATEVLTGIDAKKGYKVKNAFGENVYIALEKRGFLQSFALRDLRTIDMRIFDNYGNEVVRLHRPFRCVNCLIPCLQKLEIIAPTGSPLGSVEQVWSFIRPLFVIKNAFDEVVMHIRGPACAMLRCGTLPFQILSLNGDEIGEIIKHRNDLGKDNFSDGDYIGITFPLDMQVRMKAIIMAAAFLIKIMHFRDECYY